MGLDAIAVSILENEPVPPAVRAMIDSRHPMRIYPVEGGYLYKWRQVDAKTPIEGFEREAKGWDHEHCDVCNRTIAIGKTAWLTKRAPYYSLCPYCYRRIRQISGESEPHG
jgi:hypothetical protein